MYKKERLVVPDRVPEFSFAVATPRIESMRPEIRVIILIPLEKIWI